MNVKIIETGEVKGLRIVARGTGIEWTADLIGNAGAFVDGQFTWSEEDNAYFVSEDNYDWWARYIQDREKTEDEVEALAEQLDIYSGDIWKRIGKNTDGDYESHRRQAIQAMNEIREES